MRGGVRFLDRPEVQVALDELRTATRTAPGRRFEEHLTDLVAAARELSEERREHADALVRLGREYLDTEGRPGSVDGFINFLHAALRNDDGDDRADAVQLLTFHRAKGLEFDTVFVTGVERGLVPISHAKTPEALDEEQRLLYVALSRAEHTLHMSWARRRTVGMRTSNRTPSSWLTRVERAIDRLEGREPEPAADPKQRIADARDRVANAKGATSERKDPAGNLPQADAPLYDALVEWRRRISRASGAPAYVVFHDTTLVAVVEAKPRTRTDLLAVAGIGPIKAERYGAEVLALVAAHARAVQEPSGPSG